MLKQLTAVLFNISSDGPGANLVRNAKEEISKTIHSHARFYVSVRTNEIFYGTQMNTELAFPFLVDVTRVASQKSSTMPIAMP